MGEGAPQKADQGRGFLLVKVLFFLFLFFRKAKGAREPSVDPYEDSDARGREYGRKTVLPYAALRFLAHFKSHVRRD